MLKRRLHLFAALAVASLGFGLSSCGEKESGGGGEPAAGGSGEGGEPIAAPVVAPTASADERAAALGYAKYLPEGTEGFFALYDGKGFVDSMRGSKLGTFLEERIEEETGADFDEATEDPQAALAASVFAEEFFVAVGEGTPQQANNLVRLGETINAQQMKMMIMMADMAMGGDAEGLPPQSIAFGMIESALQGPDGGIAILETAQMPPVTIGTKISDEDTRGQVAAMLAGGLGEMLAEIGPDGEDVAEPVNVKRGEADITGLKIIGKKVVGKLGAREKEEMAEAMGPANAEKLFSQLEEKNLVIATGSHDGYVVLFLGSDIEEFQVAESAGASYAASGDLAFVDGHLGKPLLSVTSMSGDLLRRTAEDSTILASMAKGIKEGLGETKNLGDTRDMEVLLDLLVEQEEALMAMYTYQPTGIAMVRDGGLKVELYGMHNAPNAELKTPRKFASIGERDGVFLFSNWVSNEDYGRKALQYLDTLGEVAYLGASRVAKMDIDDRDFEDFREGFGLFDQNLRPHLLEIWGAVRGDLFDGLGAEGAIVVDMKGGLPTVPGIPQVIADKGQAPRIAVVAPVVDREKISSSWTRLNGAAEELLKFVSEMSGENIPMQKPMSSKNDDLQTWFFATIPFQTDDFVLSVSVDDEHFFASTSKSFVEELSGALADAEADAGDVGAVMLVDFNVLRAYVNQWIALVDENAEELFGGPDGAAGFRGELPKVREVIEATEDIDSITGKTWMEGGLLRSTLHFKVK